ncbi:cell division protein FtsA [Rhodanobacter lindaniclasticus]
MPRSPAATWSTRNSHGNAAIREREVTAGDLEQVLEAASAVAIPADRKVLYKESQEYRIDGQDGIRRPVGMSGVRLEANVHLVTGAAAAVQNITKCIQRCGLTVDELVPSALASAKSVLTDDERELGEGARSTSAPAPPTSPSTPRASIRHTASLPVGGDQVTSDITYGVHTPTAHAEEIKIKYACAKTGLAHAEETIQVPSVGDRPPRRLARQALAQSVQARYEEIFEMVQDQLRRSGYESLRGRRRGAHRRRREDGRRAGAGRGNLPTKRYASACRSRSMASARWFPARCMPPRWACCCMARAPAARGPAGRWAAAWVGWSTSCAAGLPAISRQCGFGWRRSCRPGWKEIHPPPWADRSRPHG